MGDKFSRSKDILGRVYKYLVGQFASAETKKGGQFYTPQSVVALCQNARHGESTRLTLSAIAVDQGRGPRDDTDLDAVGPSR
jgi:hypothetical protein